MSLQPFNHTAECPRDQPTQSRKVAGAVIRWCPACDSQGVAIPPRPAPAPIQTLATLFRCRAHGKPVTAAGTGCPKCEAEREAAKQRKTERRAKARARTTK